MAPPAERAPSRWTDLLAAALYLGVVLWAMRAVLPAPADTLPFPAMFEAFPGHRIQYSDQKFVAWNIVEVARRLLNRPWAVFDGGQCYPVEHSLTLGEHMLAEGVLAVLPYLVTRDPVLTYNLVVIMAFWLAGLAMYALVRHWTGSTPAAFVAGLLFMVHPTRLLDPGHPMVHGNLWTPLALLFAHRLFVHGRWRDAAGLALFIGLQALESVYPLVAFAILGGVHGVYLAARHRRRLPELVPKLALVGVATVGVLAAVAVPYLETRRTWGVLRRSGTLLHFVTDFGSGRLDYPGSVALVLATVGLLDRLRGARRVHGDDARLAMLVAGLLVLDTAVWRLPVPGLGIYLPSLYPYLARLIPGLDAVRAGGAVSRGMYVAVAFLAGYGVLVLVERSGAGARSAITVLLAAAVLGEFFYPPFSRWTYGSVPELRPYGVRPHPVVLAHYQRMPAGAVLDLPFTFGTQAGRLAMGDYVFQSGFHRRPVAACYNSFKVPTQDDLEALVARLPDAAAADALHALGFRTVILHGEYFPSGLLTMERNRLGRARADGRLVEDATLGPQTFFRLESPLPASEGWAALRADEVERELVDVAPPKATLEFTFRNRAAVTYHHPPPIRPTPLLVRWRRGSELVDEERVTALLPLALAPGEHLVRRLTIAVTPAAGEYEVQLAPVATPDLVLARRRVRVVRAP